MDIMDGGYLEWGDIIEIGCKRLGMDEHGHDGYSLVESDVADNEKRLE